MFIYWFSSVGKEQVWAKLNEMKVILPLSSSLSFGGELERQLS